MASVPTSLIRPLSHQGYTSHVASGKLLQAKVTVARVTWFTKWHYGRVTMLFLSRVLSNLVTIISLSLGGIK